MLLQPVSSVCLLPPERLQATRFWQNPRHYDKVFLWAAFEQLLMELAGTRRLCAALSMKSQTSSASRQTCRLWSATGSGVGYSPATGQVIITNYDPATMPLRRTTVCLPGRTAGRVNPLRWLSGEGHHVVDVTPRDSTWASAECAYGLMVGTGWQRCSTSVSGDVATY